MFSMFLFTPLRFCRSRLTLKNGYALTTKKAQYSTAGPYDDGDNNSNDCSTSEKLNNRSGLGQTVILVQQGTEIQELPLILRRYGQNDIVALCSNETSIKNVAANSGGSRFTFGNETAIQTNAGQDTRNTTEGRVVINPTTDPDNIIEQLEKCQSAEQILTLINVVPVNELNQDILTVALDKIIRVEVKENLKMLETSNDVYQKLIDQFCKKCDTKALLDMLDQFHMFLYMNKTIDRLCDELLVRSSDGCLSIIEMCESIKMFIVCRRFQGAEKFWSGLSDQDGNISPENIRFVFQVLPQLKVSRRMIVGILERRMLEIFPHLKPDAVSDIMDALSQCPNNCSNRLMKPISRWLNTDIHVVDETQLENIIHCFTTIQYTDPSIENALERYIKAKATKIKSQTLIVEILRHIASFQTFNSYILDGCAEYLILNLDKIDPGYMRDILYPYGLLSFQPTNSGRFWQSVEDYLNRNFNNISPAHMIEIMLTPIYLEMFPVNFIKRIFSPYFINLLHTRLQVGPLQAARNNLKLLDTAFTLECNKYNGPMLPRDHSDNPMFFDNRIKRIVNENLDLIKQLAGGENCFTTATIPHQLPYNSIYVIDVLFHPAGLGRLWNFNLRTDRNVYVAMLIHLPEHYDSTRQYLTGQQKMRIRHLRLIGLKVVSLRYQKLIKLSLHRKELREYIKEQMKDALPAIDMENKQN